jgi:hypothetical protein
MKIYRFPKFKLRTVKHANKEGTAVKTVGGGLLVTIDCFVSRKEGTSLEPYNLN